MCTKPYLCIKINPRPVCTGRGQGVILVGEIANMSFSRKLQLDTIDFYAIVDDQIEKLEVIQNNEVEEGRWVPVDVYMVATTFSTLDHEDVLEVKERTLLRAFDDTLEYCDRIIFLFGYPVHACSYVHYIY